MMDHPEENSATQASSSRARRYGGTDATKRRAVMQEALLRGRREEENGLPQPEGVYISPRNVLDYWQR